MTHETPRDGSTRGQVVGYGHTGLQVTDLERSIRFYRDLLGFELLAERVAADEYLGTLVGCRGVEIHNAHLRVPGSDHIVELLEYRGVERDAVDTNTANPGTAHVCLWVDSVALTYEHLRSNGVGSVDEPVLITSGPNEGRTVVYMCDPDGIRVELLQRERETV